MPDIDITKSRGKKYLENASPIVPAYVVGNPPPPVNPPGSGGNGTQGIGILLNNRVIGGVKRVITSNETLLIPEFWQYNIHGNTLDVSGLINNNGEINIG